MNTYTVYHLHSDYSLLDSCTKFNDYVDLAVEQGMTSIASTEHGRPLNWVSKKLYCDKKGIKFIHGVEIYLTENLEEKTRDNYHTILLARNFEGVKELNRMLSLSNDDDHFYYNPRLSFEEFISLSNNIITTSACLASPLNYLDENNIWFERLIERYDYLEIQPWCCQEQKDFNRKLYDIHVRTGKPLIAGTDTHNLNKYKAECRKILLVRKHKSYGNEDDFDLTWKTYDELCDMFREQNALNEDEWLEAISNTNVLADSIENFEIDTSTKYPILHGSKDKDTEEFKSLVKRKYKEKISLGIIPKDQVEAFRNAIIEEMRVFEKLDMCGFMLSMAELIGWCKENGLSIGTARGSVGGSRIAYVIDIIDLNPERWHTIFSRFCNENRVEAGDIDVDCIDSEKPKIFQYIVDRFGARHTARVAAYGTIANLSCIDDIGGALRSMHGDSDLQENPWSIENIKKIKSEFELDPEYTKARYPKLFYYFDGLVGTNISQSVHPAGMVISPINLDEAYGFFKKDDDTCLFLDMDDAHEVGAVKYDLLSLKTVAEIKDCCDLIGTKYPRTHEIDWLDDKVWDDMLRSPISIFQMESDFAFTSLKKFRPRSIEEMSLVTACIRPSGISYRDNLLARKPHSNPSEQIDKLLENNNGYLIYQEDVIAFLQNVCGLSGSDADTCRRAIGHKDKEAVGKFLPKIIEGYCSNSSKPRNEAEEECKEFLDVIDDASSYMFG